MRRGAPLGGNGGVTRTSVMPLGESVKPRGLRLYCVYRHQIPGKLRERVRHLPPKRLLAARSSA